MPINRVKDKAGGNRFEFEFSRRIEGRRLRARKLLPATWSRSRADAFDRQECARLYAQASGIEARRWLIDEAIARYLDERAVELKTGSGIAQELANMAGYWRGQPLDGLHSVCSRFTKDYRSILAPATIMNRLRYLIAACRWGWERHKMGDRDPGAGIAMPAVSNRRHVYIDRRQMLAVARACKDRPTRAAIRIAFYSGMRLGEIERAERLPGAFVLADTKNGEPRIVPMHPKVAICASIPLGTRYQTGYHFRKARALAGLPKLRFHDLRHSAASALINDGASLFTVGAILGHKSQASTGRYSHLSVKVQREAIERLGRPNSSPLPSSSKGTSDAVLPMEARAGVEPTYSDLQSRKRA